jgi:hypothetical protein
MENLKKFLSDDLKPPENYFLTVEALFAATSTNMATDAIGDILAESDQSSESDLHTFLRSISLGNKYPVLFENGLKEVEHLKDVEESDIAHLSLTVFEFRHMRREIEPWLKKRQGGDINIVSHGHRSIPQYKTSSTSTVITLPKAFRNIVQTRDGQGNIVVSTNSLKKKFKNLWYENPVNPNQTFSNSFILGMAEQRMQFEKSLRDCELWCRKQRSMRIQFLLASARNNVVLHWNSYYKRHSVLGMCQIAEERYSAVSAFLSNTSSEDKETELPPKSMYEMLCNYVGLIEDASNFSTAMLAKLDDEVQACSNRNGVAKRGIYLYSLPYIFYMGLIHNLLHVK